MRRLSESAAARCEQAVESVCRCRCKGALHGANRGDPGTLPLGDPHSTKRVKCSHTMAGRYSCGRWAVAEENGRPLCEGHTEAGIAERRRHFESLTSGARR